MNAQMKVVKTQWKLVGWEGKERFRRNVLNWGLVCFNSHLTVIYTAHVCKQERQ